MKIIVIGSNGQLASELRELSNTNVEIICLGRNDLNIYDDDDLFNCLAHYEAQAVINAAAYTAVDLAEENQESAMALNYHAVSSLAKVCRRLNLFLLHVSTDFVFDGKKSTPYFVDDDRNPLSIYGKSKVDGEDALTEMLPDSSCIIRTSWVYSVYGNNFVKTMLKLMSVKQNLSIVSDQIGSPTSAYFLANACVFAVVNKIIGIHHWTGLGVASWYDFAVSIQELAFEQGILDKKIELNPISTKEYPTSAARPSYSVLDKSSLYTDFKDLKKLHWRSELKLMIEKLKIINEHS